MRRTYSRGVFSLLVLCLLGGAARAGTWNQVTRAFPGAGPNANVALLPDGRVLCSGPELTTSWYTLTPDAKGSYINGTWAQVGSSSIGRLFNPGFVSIDGRYLICGGEYFSSGTSVECEMFDPVTNSWWPAPSMAQVIKDTPAALLADGRILTLSYGDSNSYIFDSVNTTATWTKVATYNRMLLDNEAGSLLLPDGSVLLGGKGFQRYLPLTNTYVAVAQTPGKASGEFTDTGGNLDEIGPFVLLHDGRALILGANRNNGLYTPPAVANGLGSWTLAAQTPVGPDNTKPYNHGDTPACVEPDGKVLTMVTQDQGGVGGGVPAFYEYDPVANSWASVTNPGGKAIDTSAERVRMLALPRVNTTVAQIFVSGYKSGTTWLYTPSGTPSQSWKPTITSIVAPASPLYGDFVLSGTQLNGLTTGADFGDDGKMATNYPIVSLTDTSGNVTYARSFNFDQMAPRKATGGSCSFRVPARLPNGTYSVRVSANGVPSSTVNLTISGMDPSYSQFGPVVAPALM
jgi:hypothetical protein